MRNSRPDYFVDTLLSCQVKESGMLDRLEQNERMTQEALFEIMTSEASYVRSLDVLIECFMTSPEVDVRRSDAMCVLARRDHQFLFSNIENVRNISKKFALLTFLPSLKILFILPGMYDSCF